MSDGTDRVCPPCDGLCAQGRDCPADQAQQPVTPLEEAALWLLGLLGCAVLFGLGYVAGRVS